MKLKTVLAFFAFFLFSFTTTQAQHEDFHPCGTVDGKVDWLKMYQANKANYRFGSDTLYVPLTIHIVGTDIGTGYYSVDRLLDALCVLNNDFAPSNIRFFIAGEINYIDNTNYYDHTFAQGAEMMQIYQVPQTINTYFVSSPAGNCGYSSYNLGIAMNKSCSGPFDHTWAHEIGHYLSLPHPFWGWEGNTHDYNTPAPVQFGNNLVERVDGVDCHLAGDGFCDTPPDYLNFRWFCNSDNFSNTVQTDPNGETFVSDGSFFMSYAGDDCMSRFSDEQIEAMRANLLTEKADHLYPELPDPSFDPSDVVLVSPEEGEQLTENENIFFEWEPIPGVTDYLLEITLFSPTNSALFSYLVEGNSFIVDDLPKNKTIYWRLRPFNSSYHCFDDLVTGSFDTGETIASSVSDIDEISSISLQPNPVEAAASFFVAVETVETISAQVSIVNMAGQSQLIGNETLTYGGNQFEVSTEGLVPGMYFLQLRSEAGLMSRKFVVW